MAPGASSGRGGSSGPSSANITPLSHWSGGPADQQADKPAGPDQLADVLDRGNRVGGVLDGVERRDHVERTRIEGWWVLQVPDDQGGGGHAFAGDVQQRRRSVQACHGGTPAGRQQQREAAATANVKQPGPGTDGGRVQDRLVKRRAYRLVVI